MITTTTSTSTIKTTSAAMLGSIKQEKGVTIVWDSVAVMLLITEKENIYRRSFEWMRPS
ncbi:hypothetical protein DY000_02030474 [Brassica cretica]|uniref:Uncharacterized protein n=1 Tax=Brassica cretica TaxID=69181 RepID=A0ABQ7E0D6_BRACR|nr:hypothetical protein DY000_02030474 [Brassica cretica]